MFVISYRFKNCHGESIPVVLFFASFRDALKKAVMLWNCRECKNVTVEEANAWTIG